MNTIPSDLLKDATLSDNLWPRLREKPQGMIAELKMGNPQAQRCLRNAAGNFYINDKPTGAVADQPTR